MLNNERIWSLCPKCRELGFYQEMKDCSECGLSSESVYRTENGAVKFKDTLSYTDKLEKASGGRIVIMGCGDKMKEAIAKKIIEEC